MNINGLFHINFSVIKLEKSLNDVRWRRAWKIRQKFEVIVMKKKIYIFLIFILNLINVGSFNKALGHGKESRINKLRAYVYFGDRMI